MPFFPLQLPNVISVRYSITANTQYKSGFRKTNEILAVTSICQKLFITNYINKTLTFRCIENEHSQS